MTERVVLHQSGEWEDINSYLIYLRHLAAYHFIKNVIAGQQVLDLGCGTGYGTAFIATGNSSQVIGIDISQQALISIKSQEPGATFVTGDSVRLPLPAGVFDLVISFQVIEHIENEIGYLAEVRRILSPGGRFIVSTPNKKLRLLPFQPPFNPYHVREYDARSLKKALDKQFDEVEIQGLQATTEIMALEHERLRKDPTKVYTRLVRKRLPFSVPTPIKQLKKSI